jgi:SAM-dependent methyltransferase
MPPHSRVIDVCCGVGYGAFILAEAGHTVVAIDRNDEAVAYARKHYAHKNISHYVLDVNDYDINEVGDFDYAVMFEAIEHIEHPLPVLQALHRRARNLLASVPNEVGFPYANYKYHFRHYTPCEFNELLIDAGFTLKGWFGQAGKESYIEPDLFSGRTLIAVAGKAKGALIAPPPDEEIKPSNLITKHIVILGLGPSLESYVDLTKRMGGRHAFCDEVWGMNSLGDIIQCDKIFHMDDVRVQEIRAAAEPDSNIAEMLKWMRKHPGPIFTSRAGHPDYPGLIAFPLQDVINDLGYAYFNGTGAYAVAYAIHIGATKISMFGCDFTYPNAHQAEKGRACVEFWLGVAAARGIKIAMSDRTTLMDTIDGSQILYGYDMVDVEIAQAIENGPAVVTFTDTDAPTAEEIEARYDHSAHPNKLVHS